MSGKNPLKMTVWLVNGWRRNYNEFFLNKEDAQYCFRFASENYPKGNFKLYELQCEGTLINEKEQNKKKSNSKGAKTKDRKINNKSV